MKSCMNCGADAPDDAGECAACGRPFSYVAVTGNESAPISSNRTMRRRPDGSLLLGLGAGSMGIAATALLIAMSQSARTFGSVGGQLLSTWIAGGLFQLGLVLLLAGAIVRAIWFLPGAETKEASSR